MLKKIPKKPKAEYQKIPVKPDVYAKVRMIADLNDRGMGDQIAAWVKRDLPMCDHKLQGVDIEYAPSAVVALTYVVDTVRIGWYCPTCNRVYMALPTPALPIGRSTSDAVLCDGGGKA